MIFEVLLKIKRWLIVMLNRVLILAVAVLVLDVVLGVFTRYALGAQIKWTEELARFLLVWIALLGGAVAFGAKGHLGVDYFVEKMHPSARRVMAIACHLIVLFFALTIFIYGGGRVVLAALQMNQATPALGWKMGYVYLALPVAGCFMALFTVENLVEDITNNKTAD